MGTIKKHAVGFDHMWRWPTLCDDRKSRGAVLVLSKLNMTLTRTHMGLHISHKQCRISLNIWLVIWHHIVFFSSNPVKVIHQFAGKVTCYLPLLLEKNIPYVQIIPESKWLQCGNHTERNNICMFVFSYSEHLEYIMMFLFISVIWNLTPKYQEA